MLVRGEPAEAAPGELDWPARSESIAAMLPMGMAPGADVAGASGKPCGPSMVVCEDADEPRMAAILSEMSLPTRGADAGAEGVATAAAAVAVAELGDAAALVADVVASVGAVRVVVAVLAGRLPPK